MTLPIRLLAPAGFLLALVSASANSIFTAGGSISPLNYVYEALIWDTTSLDARLGPTFEALHPGALDTRPTLFQRASHAYPHGYIRVNPWQVGKAPALDTDYWSDSGQVGYIPDNPSTDPGLDRIQVYAYYDGVFAISPRLDYASGHPQPDPQTQDPNYVKLNGEAPKQPIAMARGYGLTQNEALVVYRDGLLAVAGTQTSRSSSERPYPGLVFPENKVPTGIAITTENEFALVTIWDTSAHKGQLAVVALEGKYIPSHTWPYMGLPNEGSWSSFKLLGYVDLPMAAPSSVAAASNGFWNGPSQTGGRDFGQMNLTNNSIRQQFVTNSQWAQTIAKNGYAIVASKQDNKVAIVDLTPLFTYMREHYFSSAASFADTLASRGPAPQQFPQTFAVNPGIKPTVVYQASYSAPTAVLAGQRLARWSHDYFKAYVATENGTIHILDTSSLMHRNFWEQEGALREIGSFTVGHNPVGMCFARRVPAHLPLIPASSNRGTADAYNSAFWVACRGDREVVACATYQGHGEIYLTIRDSRMDDPVAVSTAVRGPILTVADYNGKKILSFLIGGINDTRHHIFYGAGDTGHDPFEFAGELAVHGHPFLIGSANVN